MPANLAWSQSRFENDGDLVKLIYAETVQDAEGHVNTTKAVGNVHFEHNKTNLYCDSALFFRDLDLIHAYSKVHVNQGDTINMFCDSLIYDGKTKISKLQGNVRMRDKEYKLVTDSLEYNGEQSIGHYQNFATITSITNDMKLTSIKGFYHANLKTFFFKDSVRITHPDYNLESDTLEFRTNTSTAHIHGPTIIYFDSSRVECSKGTFFTKEDYVQLWNGATLIDTNRTFYADSLLYNQGTRVGEGYMNVDLYDSTENVQFKSDYLWKSSNNDSLILTDNAKIIQYNKDDTLFLLADSIFHYEDTLTEEKTSIFQTNVAIINGDLRVRCDSAYFGTADSIIKFHKNPIMWSQNTQMTSDSILSSFYDEAFHEVYLYHNSFICNEQDTSHYDQLKGKFMTAWIDSSKIQKVFIQQNSESIYFTSESKKDSLNQEIKTMTGRNKIDCNEIYIHFKESEINSVSFVDQPTAKYSPIESLKPTDFFLKGFKWQIGLKPERILIE